MHMLVPVYVDSLCRSGMHVWVLTPPMSMECVSWCVGGVWCGCGLCTGLLCMCTFPPGSICMPVCKCCMKVLEYGALCHIRMHIHIHMFTYIHTMYVCVMGGFAHHFGLGMCM